MIGSPLGQPTMAQLIRWDHIRDIGCVVCRLYYPWLGRVICDVHHLTVGGKHGAPRRGHDESIGLCLWHHRGHGESNRGRREMLGPSYASEPVAFRTQFGDDDFLLTAQNELIELHRRLTSIMPGEWRVM